MCYFFIAFLFTIIVKYTSEEVIDRPLSELNVKQLISRYGYPIETHQVITEDGYILELHRIPYGINKTYNGIRPAVLIVSGFVCSSADWVNLGPNRSLALILADNGYDVWLCNNRGSTWSKKHKYLDHKKDAKEFWNFSFEDLANHDLPASIDYIISATNQKQIYYMGHSQGTISYFAMQSEKPHYNDKIRLMMAFGTADSIKNAQFPFKFLKDFLEGYHKAIGDKNFNFEILPNSGFLASIMRILCQDNSSYQDVCVKAYYFLSGYVPSQLNKTTIPLIIRNFPAGASIKQVRHFVQTKTGGFRKFDYGLSKNREIYGQDLPPSYNLSKVVSPVALYYGKKDVVLSYKRAKYLAENLPNVVVDKLYDNFGHLDFMWGIGAVTQVYKNILETMKKY